MSSSWIQRPFRDPVRITVHEKLNSMIPLTSCMASSAISSANAMCIRIKLNILRPPPIFPQLLATKSISKYCGQKLRKDGGRKFNWLQHSLSVLKRKFEYCPLKFLLCCTQTLLLRLLISRYPWLLLESH